MANQRAFQDRWQDKASGCWGCGSRNEHGLGVKSYWSGDEAVCTWTPKPYHAAAPGVLCGGIIASLIDCHSTCTAMAAAYRTEARDIATEPLIWYATASLQVSYLRPTPIDAPVVLRAGVKECLGRRTVVACSLFSGGEECARGEVVAVRVTDDGRRAA